MSKTITIDNIDFRAFVAYIGADGDLAGRLDYNILDQDGNYVRNDSMVLALTDDEKATILGIIGPYCDQTKVASGINTQTEVDAQPTVVVLVKQQEGGGGVIKVPPAAKKPPMAAKKSGGKGNDNTNYI